MMPGSRGRLHLNVQGEGEPAVFLEAGIAATSLSWARIQAAVAGYTSAASYDRAGLGWSDQSEHSTHRGESAR